MKCRYRRLVVTAMSTILAAAGLVQLSSAPAQAAVADPAALVNPLLGTSGAGNTFPGADAPFGMVQWSPDTPSRPAGGNYSYSDSSILGFSLNHLSGAGCNATADMPILPTTTSAVDGSATVGFSHSAETASAGAYAVTLGNGVKTELTATPRTGMARFTFPRTTTANLLFKMAGGATRADAWNFTRVSDTEVRGWVRSGHFCADNPTYTMHFAMVFDRPMSSSGSFAGGNYVRFDTTGNAVVHAKVGVSYVSVDNAVTNRTTENAGWNFDGTRGETHRAWNDILGRVAVSGGTRDQQVVFYTALYHALLHPNIYSDVNGQYTGFDGRVHTVAGQQRAQYATFSGWDIYRTQAQLHALVAPQQASDAAQSLVNDYAQGGFLPKWSLGQADTDVMNGDPAAIILSAYHAFGATAFDTAAAKTAMVTQASSSNALRKGQRYISQLGYLPYDGTYESGFYGSVATTLEYASSDFAISAFAGRLGDSTTQTRFATRAQTWRNVFNPATGFMQGRSANGAWRSGFDAATSVDMVEGTSWQYTGMVPFNLRGLADAMGGNAAMNSYLDRVLSDFRGTSNNSSTADMGNEPSMALPWEFNYVGRPWRTQELVRKAMNELWPNDPARWSVGNDDLGTMSAWYVWSSLGLYWMTPGTADLALAGPLFPEVSISLANGRSLSITAPQAAANAPYVQSAILDGRAWNNAYLPPSVVANGGTLAFQLGTTPNTSWAAGASSAPPSYNGSASSLPDTVGLGTGAIRSGVAGKCLDVDAGSDADRTRVQSYTCNGSPAQQWTLNGDLTVRALGKCLDVTEGGTGDYARIQLYTCNGSGAQQWTPVPASGALRNPRSGKCLDIPQSSQADRVQLQLFSCNSSPAQRWGLPVTKTGILPSAIPGKCVDARFGGFAAGTAVQTWSCSGSSAQQVSLTGDGTLRIHGKCLDPSGGQTGNNARIQLSDCTGSPAQRWTVSSGSPALQHAVSGRCLDVPEASTVDGTQLQLFDCNGSPAQRWTVPS